MIIEDARILSWSPDGKLLAFKKTSIDETGGTTVFVVDPLSDEQLLVGKIDPVAEKSITWVRQPGGYLLGPYRVATDLSSANRITDIVLDATEGGSGVLSGVGEQDLITITCLNPDSGLLENLVTVNLSGVGSDLEPGVFGELSPMGNWVSLLVHDRGSLVHQLRLCGSVREVTFPGSGSSSLGSFSGDDRWYAQRQSLAGDVEQILLYDLALESTIVLPTVNRAQYSWLNPIGTQINGDFSLSGQVRSETGEGISDVTVLVDGMEKAITERNGRFKIEGFVPGSYMIAVERAGINFSPNSVLINVPPDAEGIDFIGSLPAPVDVPPEPDVVVPGGGEPEIQERPESEPLSVVLPVLPMDEVNLILLLGAGILLLVVVVAVPLWFRRRKSRVEVQTPAVPVVKSAKEEVPTQPVHVAQVPEAPQPDAPTQPVQVSQKETVSKLEEPVEPVGEEQLHKWLVEGIEEIKVGDYKPGTEKLFKVVQHMPENASAWMWLGWVAGKQNDLQKAKGCFIEARRLGHPRASEGLAWLKRKG
jgi:hypothetical protein